MASFFENKDFNQLINSTNFFVEYDVQSSLAQEGLKTDDYVKVIIDKIKINQNDTQIKSIGILNDFAKTSEKETYFGSIINEDKEEEEDDNFIL